MEGTLEYLDRTDHSVEVRGFRIVPGDIEAWLTEHAEVRAAGVAARKDAPGKKRLVAYAAGEEASGADAAPKASRAAPRRGKALERLEQRPEDEVRALLDGGGR